MTSALTIQKDPTMITPADEGKSILQFKIERACLGEGGQGSVHKVVNASGKAYAFKTIPLRGSIDERDKSLVRFKTEVESLLNNRHRNVIQIHECGWTQNGWFDVALNGLPDSQEGVYGLFYAMDLYSESLYDLENKASMNTKRFTKAQFEQMVDDMCHALEFIHQNKVYHRDLKPENILWSESDQSFVLSDFGIAVSGNYYSPKRRLIRKGRNIKLNEVQYDIAFLADTITDAFSLVSEEYAHRDAKAIRDILEATCDDKKESIQYDSAKHFYKDISSYFGSGGWKINITFGSSLSPDYSLRDLHVLDSQIKIPVSGGVPISRAIRRIVDTKEFQRLRHVQQLGPTSHVYPGANHTRFEHSLGVYSVALKYMSRLANLPNFRRRCIDTEFAVRKVVAAALLHDIGHYPFSHWIEEMDHPELKKLIPSHEERAGRIIKNGELSSLLHNDWGLTPEDVTELITGEQLSDHGPGGRSVENEFSLLKSIISGPIDVDKIDYLIRDSVHCGVPYGAAIDVGRIVDSLYVAEEGGVCLTNKGRNHLELLLAARNALYANVYWHKTVRCSMALLKNACFRIASEDITGPQAIQEAAESGDQIFIDRMVKHCESNKNLRNLTAIFEQFRGGSKRGLYKTVFAIPMNLVDLPVTNKLKDVRAKVLEASYTEIFNFSESLGIIMSNELTAFRPEHPRVIIEVTPAKQGQQSWQLQEFRLCDLKLGTREQLSKTVIELDSALGLTREIYMFVPDQFIDIVRQVPLADLGDWMYRAWKEKDNRR